MANDRFDVAIIGGGLLGLATALALGERCPDARLAVLEKEAAWARHQSGRNSGVIHSGIYYKPGSFKAQFARAGNIAMQEFCLEHGIAHEMCGKLIVATRAEELPLLENLYQRGLANGLEVTKLSVAEAREVEPYVNCVAAIRVPSTGIVDYRHVADKYAELVASRGGSLQLDTSVQRIHDVDGGYALETTSGDVHTRWIVNCAGLFSDRLARSAGIEPHARIIPFRGEYYELRPEKQHLVNTLIYPVPNPELPFLGVHLTRTIAGGAHAGPNAVLSLKREGYTRRDFDSRDVREILGYKGFWNLARRHASDAASELARSFSKALFVRSLQRLVPAIEAADLVPADAGVRAQAVKRDGSLVDDFLIVDGRNAVHVCNAPSPGATSSLEIGRAIAARVSLQVEPRFEAARVTVA